MCPFDTIFDFLFSKEMAHDVVGGFVGFVIGVIWSNHQLKKERGEQSKLLRKNLVKGFRFNLERIQQCLGYLQKNQPTIPNFRLDASTVGHILFMGRNLFQDETWFDHFNWQRYQLEHINAKLDYIQLNLNPQDENQKALLQKQYVDLVTHLLTTKRELTELIANFEKSVADQIGD
jgi:hypothetical protein